jgi:hypothetical protein
MGKVPVGVPSLVIALTLKDPSYVGTVVQLRGGDSDTGTPVGFAAAPPAANSAAKKTLAALDDNIPRMIDLPKK